MIEVLQEVTNEKAVITRTISPLGFAAMNLEDLSHKIAARHDRRWAKDRFWCATLSNYRSSHEIDRKFNTVDDQEYFLEFRPDELLVGQIIEFGFNERISGKYGTKHRGIYIVIEKKESTISLEYYPSPFKAFKALSLKVKEEHKDIALSSIE